MFRIVYLPHTVFLFAPVLWLLRYQLHYFVTIARGLLFLYDCHLPVVPSGGTVTWPYCKFEPSHPNHAFK